MIIKILKPPKNQAKRFDGVRYNTTKVDQQKGELMVIRNFGMVSGLSDARPQDYVNYLETWSRRNSKIKAPQFHAVLSVKGREMDKFQLCDLAEQWLSRMGYGDNPYLLIFHKDTANNHVHMVSSRVGADGKKINDSFEYKRAYAELNELIAIVPANDLKRDLATAMSYQFATRAQFMLLLEARGYTLKSSGENYLVYKYGRSQGNIRLEQVDQHTGAYQANKQRLVQLRQIVDRYRASYSAELYPLMSPQPGGRAGSVIGYASELTVFLKERFGLQFIFHSKHDQPPYGYTVIDHAQKAVYKGGLLQPLADLTQAIGSPAGMPVETLFPVEEPTGFRRNDWFAKEPTNLSDADLSPMPSYPDSYVPPLRIDIAGDIDDEQVLGRNRRRKRKARTNTR